jgi:hypothetical protein
MDPWLRKLPLGKLITLSCGHFAPRDLPEELGALLAQLPVAARR